MAQMLMNPAALQTTFDSGSLTANCSIAHALKAAGRFVLFVWRGSVRVASVALTVAKDGTSQQVSLDLFAIERKSQGRPLNVAAELYTVKEGGYLVLHVSDGARGYFATLCDDTGKKALWDSRALCAGDIYSFLALPPGTYSVSNAKTGAKSAMTVGYSQPSGERQARLTPVYVKATTGGFEPAHWSVNGVQPVVLAAGAASSFAVTLTKPVANTRTKEQILAHEKDRLRQALATRFGKKQGTTQQSISTSSKHIRRG
jgi:hypothetical protein